MPSLGQEDEEYIINMKTKKSDFSIPNHFKFGIDGSNSFHNNQMKS
jgi:hypothetical protein